MGVAHFGLSALDVSYNLLSYGIIVVVFFSPRFCIRKHLRFKALIWSSVVFPKVKVSDVSHGVVQGIVKKPYKFKLVDTHGRRKGYVYGLVPQIYAESDYRKGGLPAGY